MNILVSLDSNYVLPLKVMLLSLFDNNRTLSISLYILYSRLSDTEIADITALVEKNNSRIFPIYIDDAYFDGAPVVSHYTKSMYYRLLAARFLPLDIDQVLYLDPDILIVNSLHELYATNIDNYLFAAACHVTVNQVTVPINRIRLNDYKLHRYYNSGILLMNITRQRAEIRPEDIQRYIIERKNNLILPDQDILNGLYGEQILDIDETLYNYDVRHYRSYLINSAGKKDLNWVMKHTVILHFCGKKKPWHKAYTNKFGVLYKYYLNKI